MRRDLPPFAVCFPSPTKPVSLADLLLSPEVDQDAINIQVDRESGCEILELNITLPDE